MLRAMLRRAASDARTRARAGRARGGGRRGAAAAAAGAARGGGAAARRRARGAAAAAAAAAASALWKRLGGTGASPVSSSLTSSLSCKTMRITMPTACRLQNAHL
jgi:hypothetical protein